MPAVLTRRRIKIAALGGDGQDAPFEQAFSNIAHTVVGDRAPQLLDYELGFQLLERADEGKKAVGIMAFKINSQYAYVPVFFLRGELKGHELLWLKDQNLFVPCKENWVNKIRNQKPSAMGKSVTRQTGQLGARQPDLQRMVFSPQKFASSQVPVIADSLKPFMPKYARLMLRAKMAEATAHCQNYFKTELNLDNFLKEADYPAMRMLSEMLLRHPKVAKAFAQWHDLDALAGQVKAARSRWESPDILDALPTAVLKNRGYQSSGDLLDDAHAQKMAVARSLLAIHISDFTEDAPPSLSDEDREKLLTEGIVIKDRRDDDATSRAYVVRTEERLFNPSDSGLYDVMVKPGEFRKCYVCMFPVSNTGTSRKALVVDLDGESPRKWTAEYPQKIWCGNQYVGNEFREWFDGLADSPVSTEDSGYYVMVGPRGSSTMPFAPRTELGDNSYEAWFAHGGFCGCGDLGSPDGRPPEELRPVRDADKKRMGGGSGERVHLESKTGTALRASNGDVYVPAGYKALRVTGQYDGNPLSLGAHPEAQLYLAQHTTELSMRRKNARYGINGGELLPFPQMLACLVGTHGLREKAAREILDTLDSRETFRFRVKYADPYLTDQQPAAPAFPEMDFSGYNPMGFQGPVQPGHEMSLAVPDLAGYNYDRQNQNPNPMYDQSPSELSTIQNAAQTGQREVFDTSVMGAMLKATRDDKMIGRYVPKLYGGMDALGNIIFMFYAHGDLLSDKYGQQDMPELEDSLINTFESMGDVILFLEEKTVDPFQTRLNDLDLDMSGGL